MIPQYVVLGYLRSDLQYALSAVTWDVSFYSLILAKNEEYRESQSKLLCNNVLRFMYMVCDKEGLVCMKFRLVHHNQRLKLAFKIKNFQFCVVVVHFFIFLGIGNSSLFK